MLRRFHMSSGGASIEAWLPNDRVCLFFTILLNFCYS